MSDSFYLVLPSNSNMGTYPTNYGGQFTVELESPLYLDATYQVGLVEAMYHRDWNNVRGDENYIRLEWKMPNPEKAKWEAKHWVEIELDNVKGGKLYVSFAGYSAKEVFQYILLLIVNGIGFSYFTKELITDTVSIQKTATIDDIQAYYSFQPTYYQAKFPNINTTSTNIKLHTSEHIQHFFKFKPIETITDSWLLNVKVDDTHPLKDFVTKTTPVSFENLTQVAHGVVPPKRYLSSKELMDAFNNTLKKMTTTNIVASSVPISKTAATDPTTLYRIKLVITPKDDNQKTWWRLLISPPLCRLLGLGTAKLKQDPTTHHGYIVPDDHDVTFDGDFKTPSLTPTTISGDFEMNVMRDADSLWIYSNIVEGQITGNTKSPLLRILPAEGAYFGDTIIKTYETPQYKRLITHTIQQITCSVYTSTGRTPIDFKEPVVLTLHFKRF